MSVVVDVFIFFFKQKTAYEVRISDWSSDVRSSDLDANLRAADAADPDAWWNEATGDRFDAVLLDVPCSATGIVRRQPDILLHRRAADLDALRATQARLLDAAWRVRSEEHTSELQSLMRISYAVFCLKKKTTAPNSSPPTPTITQQSLIISYH